MITLINGYPQAPNGLIVPNGSIAFQLNVDATVIAAPGGFVSAAETVVFQFNAAGQIQPNVPALAAQIYSNKELQPQNSEGLGTYYLVTFYDANGARINKNPMWWQFPEAANATVDISQLTPISTVGGNVIFYPTSFGGGGSVTSVAFVGDGTIFSVTPSVPVISAGNIGPTLLTQSAMTFLAGPSTPGPAALPTFRAIVIADLPVTVNVWSSLTAPTANLTLATTTFNTTFNSTTASLWKWANITAATSSANQNSPILELLGTYWTGSVSAVDGWNIQTILGSGANPSSTLSIMHNGTGGGGSVTVNTTFQCGSVGCTGGTVNGAWNLSGGAATGGSNQPSQSLVLNGAWWNGSASVVDATTIQDLIGTGSTPTSFLTISNSGAFSWGGVSIIGAFKSQVVTVTAATPTGAAGQVSFGTTAGFGNGAAGQAVTTTLKNTGSGPTTPQTVVNYLEIAIAGTKFWIPLVQ